MSGKQQKQSRKLLKGKQSFISSFTFSEYWEKHADVQLVQWIQAKTSEQAAGDEGSDFTSSEEEENSRKLSEADGNEAYEKDKQKSSSGPEDSDSNSEFDVCNKFSVLGAGE
jgi:hypothetical protein